MRKLPPEDQPDAVWIGPVGPIPIFHDDDPRLEDERLAWSVARARAQAMHSPDELVGGMSDPDWRVGHEVIDRLIARAGDDRRTLPTLLESALTDDAWQVRDAIAMRLCDFDRSDVASVLRAAETDSHSYVRWSARYSLFQLGLGPWPGDHPE